MKIVFVLFLFCLCLNAVGVFGNCRDYNGNVIDANDTGYNPLCKMATVSAGGTTYKWTWKSSGDRQYCMWECKTAGSGTAIYRGQVTIGSGTGWGYGHAGSRMIATYQVTSSSTWNGYKKCVTFTGGARFATLGSSGDSEAQISGQSSAFDCSDTTYSGRRRRLLQTGIPGYIRPIKFHW